MSMLQTLTNAANNFFSLMGQENNVLQTLDAEVRAAVERMQREDPGLKELLANAHAYAVFPSIGKATAVIGGAFGKGEVFEKGNLIGYAAVAQLTIGAQVGGQTFSQIIVFENAPALERFKEGGTHFAAYASAVLVKAGAAAAARYEAGVAVFAHAEGGMMVEAAIGAQKFFFRPAAIGLTRPAPSAAMKSWAKPKTRAKRPAAKKRAKPKAAAKRPKTAKRKKSTKRPARRKATRSSR
jgi:lipid-binding SYLF domain-containing protein